uniref:Uncharacterized protein n=1 Tax=Anguilla anguilla TaxID=7936 RepID=A0A0E9Q278_ANGAN
MFQHLMALRMIRVHKAVKIAINTAIYCLIYF